MFVISSPKSSVLCHPSLYPRNGQNEVERNSEREPYPLPDHCSRPPLLWHFFALESLRCKGKISSAEAQVSFCDVCSFNSYNLGLQKGSEGPVGPRGQAGKAGERVSLGIIAAQLLFNVLT